jgi:hypothetical protein
VLARRGGLEQQGRCRCGQHWAVRDAKGLPSQPLLQACCAELTPCVPACAAVARRAESAANALSALGGSPLPGSGEALAQLMVAARRRLEVGQGRRRLRQGAAGQAAAGCREMAGKKTAVRP